jgi:hypothetical protein
MVLRIGHCHLRLNGLVLEIVGCQGFINNLLRPGCQQKFRHLDWAGQWYLESMGLDSKGRLAIIDDIPCINPQDWTKQDGKREIDRLQTLEERRAIWEQVKKRYGVSESYDRINYGLVKKPMLQGMFASLTDILKREVYKVLEKILLKPFKIVFW